MYIADEIRKLAELRAEGVLSDEELTTAKARLLGSTAARVAENPSDEARGASRAEPDAPLEVRWPPRPSEDTQGRARGGIAAADAPGWRSANAGLLLLACSHLLYLIGLGVTTILLPVVDYHIGIQSFFLALLWPLWLFSWMMMLWAGSSLVLIPNRLNARGLAIAIMSWSALLLLSALVNLQAPWGQTLESFYTPYRSHGEQVQLWFQLRMGYEVMFTGLLLPAILEIIRLTLLACLLRAIVRALQLRLAVLSILLMNLTPILLAGFTLCMDLGYVYPAPHWAVTLIPGIVSLAVVHAAGLVLMVMIWLAIRYRLRQAETVPFRA
jgi:hypothetical protein